MAADMATLAVVRVEMVVAVAVTESPRREEQVLAETLVVVVLMVQLVGLGEQALQMVALGGGTH